MITGALAASAFVSPPGAYTARQFRKMPHTADIKSMLTDPSIIASASILTGAWLAIAKLDDGKEVMADYNSGAHLRGKVVPTTAVSPTRATGSSWYDSEDGLAKVEADLVASSTESSSLLTVERPAPSGSESSNYEILKKEAQGKLANARLLQAMLKKDWPALGGSGTFHPMAGPWPKTPPRGQWYPPPGWMPPSKPVLSWFDMGKRLVPPVLSWYDLGDRLTPAADDAASECMEVLLQFRGITASATVATDVDAGALADAAESLYELEGQKVTLVLKGVRLQPGVALSDTPLAASPEERVLVMAQP